MRVKIEGNVLTVVTDIPKAVVDRGIADLKAYDDKQNEVYRISMSEAGNLAPFGISANTVIDGKLALVLVEAIDFTREDFIRKYGKAVVAAQKFCPIIANAAASEEELLEAAFA